MDCIIHPKKILSSKGSLKRCAVILSTILIADKYIIRKQGILYFLTRTYDRVDETALRSTFAEFVEKNDDNLETLVSEINVMSDQIISIANTCKELVTMVKTFFSLYIEIFYIFSKEFSNGLIDKCELIVSYIQVVIF